MGTLRKKSPAAPAVVRTNDLPFEETDGRKSVCRPDEMPADVLEFITAIDEYKRVHQRPFPTWSEVLEILKGLGYGREAS